MTMVEVEVISRPPYDGLAVVEHLPKGGHSVQDGPTENLAGERAPVDDGVEVVVGKGSHAPTLTTNSGSVKQLVEPSDYLITVTRIAVQVQQGDSIL